MKWEVMLKLVELEGQRIGCLRKHNEVFLMRFYRSFIKPNMLGLGLWG